MNSKILRGLCESYQNIYDGGFESWVDSLIEEGYDLSDYTWEEMYDVYINEALDTPLGFKARAERRAAGPNKNVNRRPATTSSGPAGGGMRGMRGTGRNRNATQTSSSPGALRVSPSAKPPAPAPKPEPPAAKPPAPAPAPKPEPPAAKPPAPAPASRPPAPAPATRPAAPSPAASTPKPFVKQTGDKAKDMATWAKANPTLAAASAEKSRIRGTQQTDNPLMRDMKSRLPMNSPSVQSSNVSKLGSGNQSLVSNPNSLKSATPKKPMTQTQSFEWGSHSKILDDIANTYASIYEAKKKDQDQDGDNDFADVQIARMIASGMSKAQAIAAVKGKPYNEEYELDEGLGSAIKGLFGRKKKEEEEVSKPESRGAELRRKYNVGPENSDTSAKRQILNRSRARKERDEERYGNSVYTKKVAQQSADAHDRYLRAGYSKYGADLKHGRGNKARKRVEALQREEFEFWVNSLIEEGYDLSDYTWDEMYEIYEETAEERDARIAARRARVREMEAQGKVMTSSRRTSERARQRRQEKKDEALERAANRALADTIGTTRRSDKPMGSEAPAPKEAAPAANRRLGRTVKRDTLASRADELLKMLQNEDFELWLEDLIEEGYDLKGWTNGEIVDLYQEIYGNVD